MHIRGILQAGCLISHISRCICMCSTRQASWSLCCLCVLWQVPWTLLSACMALKLPGSMGWRMLRELPEDAKPKRSSPQVAQAPDLPCWTEVKASHQGENKGQIEKGPIRENHPNSNLALLTVGAEAPAGGQPPTLWLTVRSLLF